MLSRIVTTTYHIYIPKHIASVPERKLTIVTMIILSAPISAHTVAVAPLQPRNANKVGESRRRRPD